MKKRLSLLMLLLLALCLLLTACKKTSDKLSAPINQNEYVLYRNIFSNKQAAAYTGREFTKTGIFITLEDCWNNRTRYYVWGYYDQTKCCDWQWEFTPKDPGSLPPVGSLVKMTGKLTYSDDALDKYWFPDATVDLQTEYTGERTEVDLSLMDATLERVQLQNLQHAPERFEGKTVRLYGRVKTPGSIQHPYYDNSWAQSFETTQTVPPIGTLVMVTGTWKNGVLTNAAVVETKDY